MRRCPYGAEEIQDEAVVCRFCGRKLRTARRWLSPRWLILAAAATIAIGIGVAALAGAFRSGGGGSSTDGGSSASPGSGGATTCSLYQRGSRVIVVFDASDAEHACHQSVTEWTRSSLGTSSFWQWQPGDRTAEADPNSYNGDTFGAQLDSVCTATYKTGATINVYDTGGTFLGNEVCHALASTDGWTVG